MTNISKKKSHEAVDLFNGGVNCAQAVLLAYHKECGISKDIALNIAAPFLGGVARQREVCGAVVGMSMAIGLIHGSSKDNSEPDVIKLTKDLCAKFKERHGSVVCRDVLVGRAAMNNKEQASKEVNKEYYASKPCARCVEDAAEFIEEHFTL